MFDMVLSQDIFTCEKVKVVFCDGPMTCTDVDVIKVIYATKLRLTPPAAA